MILSLCYYKSSLAYPLFFFSWINFWPLRSTQSPSMPSYLPPIPIGPTLGGSFENCFYNYKNNQMSGECNATRNLINTSFDGNIAMLLQQVNLSGPNLSSLLYFEAS